MKNNSPTTAEITAPVSAQTVRAHSDWVDASRAARSVKLSDPGFYKTKARSRLASEALTAARNSDRAAFERARGWKFSKCTFTLRQLKVGSPKRKADEYSGSRGPEIDHAEYLRIGRRPVAILSHSYATWEALQAFAESHGLDAERLPASWYYPGGTQAVVFTPKAANDANLDLVGGEVVS